MGIDPFLIGNESIEKAIERYYADTSKENLIGVLDALCRRMQQNGHFIVPVIASEDEMKFAFRTVQLDDGSVWMVLFATQKEFEKGAPSEVLSHFMDATLQAVRSSDMPGCIINPWGRSFLLTKELIEILLSTGEQSPERSQIK